MANGFIDGATMTSALTALNLGKQSIHHEWHLASLLEATYCLLFDNIFIVPRPQGPGGELGDYAIAANKLPRLFADAAPRQEAFLAVVNEADSHFEKLRLGWESIQTDPAFLDWADVMRRDRWENQTLTYNGLFDREFIPTIARVIGCSSADLTRIQKLSSSPENAKEWSDRVESDDDARIANAAWVLGGFLRGFYYDELASRQNLQLLSHRFRSVVEPDKPIQERHDFTISQEMLVKMIVGDAIRHLRKADRIEAWTTSIDRCRALFTNDRLIKLPGGVSAPRAIEFAIAVAKRIPLEGDPSSWEWLVDATFSLGLWGFGVAPWESIAGGATIRAATGKSLGKHITERILQSESRLRYLAKSVPGKIKRILKP